MRNGGCYHRRRGGRIGTIAWRRNRVAAGLFNCRNKGRGILICPTIDGDAGAAPGPFT